MLIYFQQEIEQGVLLAATTCLMLLFGLQRTLLLGLGIAWKYVFQVQGVLLFEQDISRSTFISIQYMYIKTNTLVHNACPQVSPLLPTNVCGGITLAWGHCSQPWNKPNWYKNRKI